MAVESPRQQLAEVVSVSASCAYLMVTLRLPGPMEFRPGQFAALTVGGPSSSMLLRRCFSIYRIDGELLRIVFAAHGAGTRWLAARQPGDLVDVVAPLGTPFPFAEADDVAGPAVLVGGGYGSAPLFSLAAALRERGSEAHFVLGAASADRLFGVDEAESLGATVTVTTDDGSAGLRGWVSDALPAVLDRTGAGTVYACGPMAMLDAVSSLATAAGAIAYVAVEEAMACGIGVCMTCVLPVVGTDGLTRMTRSCVAGPVFAGAAVRWDAAATGAVPADALGAAAMGGRQDLGGTP
ncbi:MAG: dihydroorotate dehydrogenase electron transfer subunit [Sporichthyaceae bacterium]|nr:dihydroorotate dehydrogenase electron transfer subunit [Sporichthyaceae bacterium]